MLLFSTILDINEKLTYEKFFDLILYWNEHQYYEENIIPGLVWNGEFGKRLGSADLWISAEKLESIVAVRYEKRTQDGVIWDTDYVMNFRNMKMAIRLERSYSDDAPVINTEFSSPYFITHLIDMGYLKKDNDLAIRRDHTYINSDNMKILADVVNGKARYKFPIVYVSKTFSNEDPVDVKKMAKRLRGMAHVLVQEDLTLNKEIQNACAGKNEYKGAIGLYFPGSSAGHKTLKYRREVGVDKNLMDKAIQLVLQYCNSHALEPMFTWQGVKNALLIESLDRQQKAREEFEAKYRESEEKRQNIEAGLSEEGERILEEARQKAKSEADELLEIFDEEQNKLKQQIAELTDANNALLIENEGLRKKISDTDAMPLLFRGEEDDFYAGEVKDLVLSVLSDALKNITEGTRRYDAVNDIIKHNNYEHLSEIKGDELKRLVKAYAGMPAQLRNDLEALGFQISDGGKHYKVQYHGDPRYTETMSKTPSDWKTGQVTSAKLRKKAF
ncbi:MAG: hypothetical protein IKH76_06815 [Clostridiales bacterium]|nr:hypothetical protein [Clostridiales bacterium]